MRFVANCAEIVLPFILSIFTIVYTFCYSHSDLRYSDMLCHGALMLEFRGFLLDFMDSSGFLSIVL